RTAEGEAVAVVHETGNNARTTEQRAFLFVAQRASEVTGVQLERGTMPGIAAGLGHVVDDRAHVAAVLGAEVVADDLELLDQVLVGNEERRTGDGVVVVRLTVNREVVGAATLAVHRDAGA